MIALILTGLAVYMFIGFGVYDVSAAHKDKFLVALFVSVAWPIFSLYMLGRMLCVGFKKWKGFEERLSKDD